MRYILDTNVILAGLRSRSGASHQLLRWALEDILPLVIHPKLVYEYRDVLSRPVNLSALPFTWEDIEIILAQLVSVAQPVEIRYLWRPNLRDENDNFLIEIAVASWPCTIITHNLKDFSKPELIFPQIDIRTPADIVRSFKPSTLEDRR